MLLWVIAIGFFMQTLDTTIVNTALPNIAASLGESPLHMQMIVFSYTLAVAVTTPVSGWLADKLGTKRIYLTALGLFCLGSFLCAISNSLSFLVCSRILQGVGGAMLLPIGRLSILRNFPKEQLLSALGFVTIPGLIGPLFGPPLGGWITEKFSWQWIFLINLPVGFLGALAASIYMPNNTLPALQAFDTVGFMLISFSMIGFSCALSVFDIGLHVAMAPVLILISAATILVYIKRAKNSPAPLFPLRLFKIKTFSRGLTGNLFARLGMGGMPYLLPLLFQVNMKYSPMDAGLMLLPSSLAAVLAKQPAVILINHYGYRSILISNTVILSVIMTSFAFISQSTPLWIVLCVLFCFGVFNSIQFTAMNTVTLKDLPEDVAASGNSMLSMTQMLSLGAAAAITSLILGLAGTIYGTGDSSSMFYVTFISIGIMTLLSTLIFVKLEKD